MLGRQIVNNGARWVGRTSSNSLIGSRPTVLRSIMVCSGLLFDRANEETGYFMSESEDMPLPRVGWASRWRRKVGKVTESEAPLKI